MLEILSTFLLAIAMFTLAIGLFGCYGMMFYTMAKGEWAETLIWTLIATCLYFIAKPFAKPKGSGKPAEKKAPAPEEEKAKQEQRAAARHKAEMEERNNRWHRIVQNEKSYNARCPRCKSKDVSYVKQKATTDYEWCPGIDIHGNWNYINVPTPGKPKVHMKCNSCGKKFTI